MSLSLASFIFPQSSWPPNHIQSDFCSPATKCNTLEAPSLIISSAILVKYTFSVLMYLLYLGAYYSILLAIMIYIYVGHYLQTLKGRDGSARRGKRMNSNESLSSERPNSDGFRSRSLPWSFPQVLTSSTQA